MGIGLLLTSIGLQWVTDWPLHERARLVVSTSLLSSAAAVGLIWTSDSYIAGVLMALIGAGMGAFTPIAWGILQESVPRRMIGRALGLYGTAAMTAAIISISLFGWITERFGPQTALLGIGLALGLTGLLAGRMKRTAAG
jgi:MFS family permease